MKFVDLLLDITLCLLIGYLGVLVYDFAHLAQRMKRAPAAFELTPQNSTGIVRILRGKETICTGTVVDDKTVITAGHCVAMETPFGMIINPDPIEVRANDNVPRRTFGKIHTISPQMDSAVLHGNFRPYSKFQLIDNIAVLSSLRDKTKKFLACGYPLSGDLYCTVVTYEDLFNFMWSVKGQLLPGMSGGPVLAPNGAIIGINDAVTGNTSIVSPIYNITKGF
jgi:hypothetical protein